ncbi:MAG TPA: RDD family protein [Alphaproteobacteria bacterium]|nr:RDD family protein [Alphaproteobacteria bacterium]
MDYAGPGLRAVEGIIDLAVTLAVLWVVAKIFGQTTEGGFNLTGAAAFVGAIVALLYFIVMEATLGATLGKLIVKLRVVNEADGSPIGWRASVVRNVLRIADGAFLYLVGFILVLATKKRQRLGDLVAGTVVTRIA